MNPLIIVAGCPRTGTSLMMQCLRENGFNLGEVGSTFICENKEFNTVTRQIIENKSEGLKQIGKFVKFLKNSDITALKINAPTLKYWMKYRIFDEAKYIRTLRYAPSVVDSLLARNKVKTKEEGQARYRRYTRALQFLDKKESITVWFEDMFIRPEETAKRLAKFLGMKEFSLQPLKPHLWHFKPDETD